MSFSVSLVQASPVYLDKEKTIEKVKSLVADCSTSKPKLIVFPEAFISGYPDWVWLLPASKKQEYNELYRLLYESSVSIGDEVIDQLCMTAKEHNVDIIVGANEKNSETSNASLFNSILYIGKEGKLLGIHRKLIPTGGERMMWSQGDGSTLHSFEREYAKIGGLICWENYMPLCRFSMYLAGVQVYAAPTWDSSESWQVAMRAYAREGGMYLISCAPAMKVSDIPDELPFKDLYPKEREWVNKGNSCIINPKSEIIAGPLEASEGILSAEINLDEIQNQKWLFDVAGHYHRSDVFQYKVNNK